MQSSLAKLPDLSLVQTGVHHSQSCHSLNTYCSFKAQSPARRRTAAILSVKQLLGSEKSCRGQREGGAGALKRSSMSHTPHLLFVAFRVEGIVKFLNTRKTQISMRLNFQWFQERDLLTPAGTIHCHFYSSTGRRWDELWLPKVKWKTLRY